MDKPMPLLQAFALSSGQQRSNGVEGYFVPRVYEDPLKKIEERQLAQNKTKPKKKITKRGNYLQDEAKIHKLVPGPGKYKEISLWTTKKNSSLKPKYSEKLTFIEETMKREKKEKKPGPGAYKLFRSQKEIQSQKKKLSVRKIKEPDRTTFLDGVQAEAISRPGVGNYNVRRRAKTQMSFSKYKTKPEQMRKKHELQSKKKPQKFPTMTSYSPHPCDYSLFSTMNKAQNKYYFGKTTRFNTTGGITQGQNPAKYSIVQEWAGKGKKVERHGLEVLSKTRVYSSVYY